MGDKFLDRTFQNAVVERIYKTSIKRPADKQGYIPGADSVTLVYKTTPPDSLLRKLMVNLWTNFLEESWVSDDWLQNVAQEFAVGVIRGLSRLHKCPRMSISLEDYLVPTENSEGVSNGGSAGQNTPAAK